MPKPTQAQAQLLKYKEQGDRLVTTPNGEPALISPRLLEILKTHPNKEAIKKLLGL